jgi:hypothetical protein
MTATGRRRGVNGEMLWFNEAKGYGYIYTEEGERIRVYEHGFLPGHVPRGRCARVPVELTTNELDGERVAVDVSFPEERDVRRARLRHSGSRRSA